MAPRVSFVVPCYRNAQYLRECVESLLAQSFRDFEVLIMDDCSPDNAREVAAGIGDDRVRYHRNESNLGIIGNFNLGVRRTRGEFVWLISADDRLRRPDVLDRYVREMTAHPRAGFVFCPAMLLERGVETRVVHSGYYGDTDLIFHAPEFVRYAFDGCPVCAPTGMMRRTCHEEFGFFPAELPRTCDWFSWAATALQHDVLYLAEPHVNYRRHETNLEMLLAQTQPELYRDNEIAVRWMILRRMTPETGAEFRAAMLDVIAEDYARRAALCLTRMGTLGLDLQEMHASIDRWSSNRGDADAVRTGIVRHASRAAEEAGDHVLFHLEDHAGAARCYARAMEHTRGSGRLHLKRLLAKAGRPGIWLRQAIAARSARRTPFPPPSPVRAGPRIQPLNQAR